MCLHDMLCCSLGVINFDVECVVMYFFENIHLFCSILKCFMHYFGLSLIVIHARDVLWFAYFKKVVPLHLPWLVFSSVCLRTINDLSMREFDKYLKCISFQSHFAAFLRKIICSML